MVPRPRADSDVDQYVEKAHGASISHPLPSPPLPLSLSLSLSLLPIIRSFLAVSSFSVLAKSSPYREPKKQQRQGRGRRTTRGKKFSFPGGRSRESGHARGQNRLRLLVPLPCRCCCCRSRAGRGERGNELGDSSRRSGTGRRQPACEKAPDT